MSREPGPHRADMATPEETAQHYAALDQARAEWADRVNKLPAFVTVLPADGNPQSIILAPEVSVDDTLRLLLGVRDSLEHYERRIVAFIEENLDG